jgi:hypothetical protein
MVYLRHHRDTDQDQVLDVATGRAPHLANGTDVLCDIMLVPYAEPYQTAFQVKHT